MENLFKKRQEQLNLFKNIRKKIIDKKEKKEIPDNVMTQCQNCNSSLAISDIKENYYVCTKCGYHMKISAKERIKQLIDKGTFKELFERLQTVDEEKFIGYEEKLNKYKKETGLNEAVICGVGEINGYKTALAVMDSYFMMGSMGRVVGEKITRLIEYAHKRNLPLIISCASGGARMQEGIISLMQMSKTSAALKRFSDDKGLYISLLTNPTTGGVSASFAMLGDIIIAEPNTLVGFAGKRVIEKTINEVLPDEFQQASFVQEKGFIDIIVERKNLKKTLSDLLMLHGGKR